MTTKERALIFLALYIGAAVITALATFWCSLSNAANASDLLQAIGLMLLALPAGLGFMFVDIVFRLSGASLPIPLSGIIGYLVYGAIFMGIVRFEQGKWLRMLFTLLILVLMLNIASCSTAQHLVCEGA